MKIKVTGTRIMIVGVRKENAKLIVFKEDDFEEMPEKGQVVAVGQYADDDIKVGDIVSFKKYALYRVPETHYWVLEEDDVLTIEPGK